MSKILPLPVLLFAFLLTGCLEEDGDSGRFSLEGQVNLFDDGQNSIANDSMAVTLGGSLPILSDTTLSDGSFQIEDIRTGVYTLIFEKEGYGIRRIYNVPVGISGAPLPEDLSSIRLGQRSTTVTTSIRDSIVGGDIFLIIGVEPAGNPNRPRYVRVFINNLGNAGPENYLAFSNVLETQSGELIFSLNRDELLDIGFQEGQTAYARAYGESFYANDYINPNLDRRVFPNLNPNAANSIFFLVP